MADDLAWLEERIADSLEEAGATLLSLPSGGAVPPHLRCTLPRAFIDSAICAYDAVDPADRLPVSQCEIEAMAVAYDWVSALPNIRTRRLLLLRSLIHPQTGKAFWGASKLGTVFGVHPDTIQGWHRKGVHQIALRLHKLAVPATEQGDAAAAA